jgi:predicted DNA-binding protein (MmcQ/YjbR family)
MPHPSQIRSPEGLAMVDRVRSLVGQLPEVTEAIDKFGHTSFRVRDKPFVIMGEGDQGPSLSIKTDSFTQQQLVDRGEYTRARYIGHHGWVSAVRVPPGDWEEAEILIADGYELVAPKSLIRRLREVDGSVSPR